MTYKSIYIALVAIYVLSIAVFFLRYEISYRIVEVKPELVEVRSLTFEEHKSLEKAEVIRMTISRIFLISSIIMTLLSAAAAYFGLISPTNLPRVMFWVCLFFTLLMILVYGISFIPRSMTR